jgi:acyl carrier protein
MELEKKKELLSDLFDVKPEEILPEQALDEFEAWDSMSKLSLIVLMDDECGKKLTGEQILQFETLGDILEFME